MEGTKGLSGSGALGRIGTGGSSTAGDTQHMLVVEITTLAKANEQGPARRHTKIVARHIQLVFLMRFMGVIRREYPALAPFLSVILFFWKIFAYLSWTIRAGTTLLLRLNKFGRRLVNKEEVIESNIVGVLWGAALGCWLYHWRTFFALRKT